MEPLFSVFKNFKLELRKANFFPGISLKSYSKKVEGEIQVEKLNLSQYQVAIKGLVVLKLDPSINSTTRDLEMTNNDSLRSLRYTFDLNDSTMIKIFELANLEVTREQVSQWLKKEEDPNYEPMKGSELSSFLDGFIIKNRGKKDDKIPKPEKWMTNNIILTKLKIALNFKSDDVKAVLALANFELSDHELSALFRKPDHKHFRKCQDQLLRAFLKGLQLKFRPT